MKFVQMAMFVVLGSFIFSNFCSAAYREPKIGLEDEQEYVATEKKQPEKKQSEYASFDAPMPEQQQSSSPQPKVEPEDVPEYVATLPIKLVNESGVILYARVKARKSMDDKNPEEIFADSINPGFEINIGFPAKRIFTLRVWKDKNDFDKEDRKKSIYSMEDTANEIADISKLILYVDRAVVPEQSEYTSFAAPGSSTSTQILEKQKIAKQVSQQPKKQSSFSTQQLLKPSDEKTTTPNIGTHKTAPKNVKQEQKTQPLTVNQKKFLDDFKAALDKSPKAALKILRSCKKDYKLKEEALKQIQYEFGKSKFNMLDIVLVYSKDDKFLDVVKYLIDDLNFALSYYKKIDFETNPNQTDFVSPSTLYFYNKPEFKKYFESKKQDPNFKNFF